MTADSNSIPTPPCAQCGTAERYASGVCKACARAHRVKYYAENKDKCKAYVVANKEKIKAKTKQYREENKELIAAREAARGKTERGRLLNAAKHLRNKEKRNAGAKAWRLANPEAYRIYRQNRRAILRESGGKLSHGLHDKFFKLQRGLCPCCREPLGDDCELDHKMPLALGGKNIDENMQLLRKACNKSKRAKHPVDYMQSRGLLL